jgi:hypothetical protein
MLKRKLNWKRPLFYLLLPVFLVMIFLGFPLPVAPPPATKARQEESAPAHKKKRKFGVIVVDSASGDAPES